MAVQQKIKGITGQCCTKTSFPYNSIDGAITIADF